MRIINNNKPNLLFFHNSQVLGKACKPIPVMILGVVLANKRYSLTKYLCILMIVAGVALFMYKDGKSQGAGFELGTGEMLLVSCC